MNIFIVNKCYGNIDVKSEVKPIIKYAGKDKSSSSQINPDDYDPSKKPLTKEEAKDVVDKVRIVLGAIRNISAVASVIILMIIGFKYMIGSVEEKANYKATMMPYVIGCIMAVTGTTIVSFIYDAVN